MFIEEFYYGNLNPQEVHAGNYRAERKALETLSAAEEAMQAILDDDTRKPFEAYCRAFGHFHSEAIMGAFESGFRLGARCMEDILFDPA